MIDVIIWIVLVIVCFLTTFCGCVQLGTCFPKLCSNHFLCFSFCKPKPTPLVKDGYVSSSDGGDLESGVGKEPPQNGYPTLAGVLTDPVALVLRLACSLLTAFILAIILIAIIVSTYSAFPGVDASECKTTCKADDDYCCTYENPLADIKDSIEDVEFTSGDAKLHGWWIPGKAPVQGTILYNHGSGSNVAGMYRQHRYVYLTQTLGMNVFVYDYPGYGKSEGSASDDSVFQSARDALEWLKTKTSLPETELFILGRSLGSSVAVRLASEVDIKAKGPGSKGVILQSAYSSYKAAAGASMSMLGFVAASVWPTDMGPPTDFAPDIKSCVHQFHSEDDEWVPISQGRKVHKLIDTQTASCKVWVETKKEKHDDPMTDAEKTSLQAWVAAINSVNPPPAAPAATPAP